MQITIPDEVLLELVDCLRTVLQKHGEPVTEPAPETVAEAPVAEAPVAEPAPEPVKERTFDEIRESCRCLAVEWMKAGATSEDVKSVLTKVNETSISSAKDEHLADLEVLLLKVKGDK